MSQVESSKVFIFKDDASHRVYMQQYTKFRDDNISRDELVEHTEVGATGMHTCFVSCMHAYMSSVWRVSRRLLCLGKSRLRANFRHGAI